MSVLRALLFIHFLSMMWLTEWQERISGKRKLPVFILDIFHQIAAKKKRRRYSKGAYLGY